MTAQPLTIGRGIRAAARRSPNKPAVLFKGQALSYAKLVARAASAAAALEAIYSVGAGDRVALVASNRPEFFELLIAVSDRGAALAMLNPRLAAKEVSAILDDADVKLVIADEESEELVSGWAGQRLLLGLPYELILEGAKSSLGDFSRERDPFAIHYTSGTTGLPKGVPISHRSRALSVLGMASEYGCYGPDDHFLAVAPLCHGAGLAFALASLYTGGTCTLLDRYDPEQVLQILDDSEITGAFFVPTHFKQMFQLPHALRGHLRNNKLKALICNAAPLHQRDKEEVISQFGPGRLFECYGSTEAGIVTNLRPSLQLVKQNCVGTPFVATDVELRDDSGQLVPDGAVGELFSRSPYLFDGYWRRPDETALAIRDGWVSVGDLARRDTDGCFYIVDRKTDMVITGGLNVYPREVENVIHRLQGVADVAVIGQPDPYWGESLHAVIVPKPNASLVVTDVLAACRAALAGYKVPKTVSFVGDLPRNAGGKVLKHMLIDAGRD